ncbi:nucleotidyltransferase, partial [Archaeoglobales archaeon]
MKAMIIAAGIGRRLADYSKGKPKTLIEISGKPILDYILSSLI